MKASVGKRVLMFVENNPYPQDGRVRREAIALTAAGYTVSVVAPKGDNQPWRENIKGVEVFRYPAPPEGDGFLGSIPFK